MCCLALKYVNDEHGWCSAKNRDRSKKIEATIKRSFRKDIERLLFSDCFSKWSEGINSAGVAISNTTLMNSKDKSEAGKNSNQEDFTSPGGKIIQQALFEKTPKKALEFLVENEMEGFSAVFNRDEAYILEGFFTVDDDGEFAKYNYKVLKCDKDDVYVRTNHGILLPEAGYQDGTGDEEQQAFYESSLSRYETALKSIKKSKITSPRDLINAIAVTPHKDWMMNPIRITSTHGKNTFCTTGQLLHVPSSLTLHYRNIWSNLTLDINKMSQKDCKTHYEIISSAELITNEALNGRSFSQWISAHLI
jgi:hypothetical protein